MFILCSTTMQPSAPVGGALCAPVDRPVLLWIFLVGRKFQAAVWDHKSQYQRTHIHSHCTTEALQIKDTSRYVYIYITSAHTIPLQKPIQSSWDTEYYFSRNPERHKENFKEQIGIYVHKVSVAEFSRQLYSTMHWRILSQWWMEMWLWADRLCARVTCPPKANHSGWSVSSSYDGHLFYFLIRLGHLADKSSFTRLDKA